MIPILTGCGPDVAARDIGKCSHIATNCRQEAQEAPGKALWMSCKIDFVQTSYVQDARLLLIHFRTCTLGDPNILMPAHVLLRILVLSQQSADI